MFWTASRVKERLHRFWEYRNFVADYRPSEEWVGIPKRKRVTFEAWFVSKALDNAFFDEAFGLLDEFSQWLLIELYMKGGYDKATKGEPDIRIKDDAFGAVVSQTGKSGREIMETVNDAFKVMLDYLNR